jgi:hypothetical protein
MLTDYFKQRFAQVRGSWGVLGPSTNISLEPQRNTVRSVTASRRYESRPSANCASLPIEVYCPIQCPMDADVDI